MAIYVTNPYGRMRHNGALNALVAKHLGLKGLKSEANRAAVAAFKRSPEYKSWLAKNEKAVSSERSAKKERTATSKKSGKNFLTEVLGYTREKGGRGKAGKLVRPTSKPAGKRTAAAAEAPAAAPAAAGKRAEGEMFKNAAGRYMVVVGGRARFATKEQVAAHEAGGAKAKGGRRRKNPMFDSGSFAGRATELLKSEVTINSLVGGGAAAAVHFVLVPMAAPIVAKIPYGVGTVLSKAPYAITGFVGAAAAAAAGAFMEPGKLRNSLVSVGGAIATFGVAIEVFNYLSRRGAAAAPAAKSDKAGLYESDMGALYESQLGGLYEDGVTVVGNPYAGVEVVSNPFDFAGTAAFGGTGGSNELGALSASYGDAKMRDAALAPLDFAVEEGQALIDGPAVIVRKFGLPVTARGARSAEYSPLVSQPMHRWAWLVRLVGFEKASQIAALPPETRLKVLAALKRQALATVNKALSMVPQQATMNTTLLSDYASLGAHGAMSATDFGATIFAGAGY
jgi:hypothetical protein